jgi:hypothetical protein
MSNDVSDDRIRPSPLHRVIALRPDASIAI